MGPCPFGSRGQGGDCWQSSAAAHRHFGRSPLAGQTFGCQFGRAGWQADSAPPRPGTLPPAVNPYSISIVMVYYGFCGNDWHGFCCARGVWPCPESKEGWSANKRRQPVMCSRFRLTRAGNRRLSCALKSSLKRWQHCSCDLPIERILGSHVFIWWRPRVLAGSTRAGSRET